MREVKQVVFGESDLDIYKYVYDNNIKFSTYVKQLIRADMEVKSCPETDRVAIALARFEEQLGKVTALIQSGEFTVKEKEIVEETPAVNETQKLRINNVMSQFGV